MVYFRDIGIVHIHEPDAFDVFNSLTEGVLCFSSVMNVKYHMILSVYTLSSTATLCFYNNMSWHRPQITPAQSSMRFTASIWISLLFFFFFYLNESYFFIHNYI